jgi:hypothetical protein
MVEPGKWEERKTSYSTTQTIGTGFPVEPDAQMTIEEKEILDRITFASVPRNHIFATFYSIPSQNTKSPFFGRSAFTCGMVSLHNHFDLSPETFLHMHSIGNLSTHKSRRLSTAASLAFHRCASDNFQSVYLAGSTAKLLAQLSLQK